MYIRYTRPMNPIRVTKAKIPRVKPAKRDEVPEAYRKVKLSTKLKPYASEILLHFIGIAEFIRKGINHDS